MPNFEIPEDVSSLLKPISTEAPTGEDIAQSDDPIANAAYSDLEMILSRMGDIDYMDCAGRTADILKTKSKHLRVAAWLCLCWYKTEGIPGFKNGLLLLLELLKNFNGQLFPEKAQQKSKAIQFLNINKSFRMLNKDTVDSQTENDWMIIQQIFRDLEQECRNQFPDFPPDLTEMAQIINDKSKSGTGSAAVEDKAAPEQEAPDAELQEETVTKRKREIQKDLHPEEETKEPAKEEETDTSSKAEEMIEVPEDVLELLADISAETPCGVDAENSDDQNTMVLYMNLETEISKLSANDYEQCNNWARELLQGKSKHLRIAVWLLIAWFRTETNIETDRLIGFRNGFLLIAELLKKYGDNLYPSKPAPRSKTLQVINSDPRLKLISKIKVDENNYGLFQEIGKVYAEIVNESKEQFADHPPRLTDITKIIQSKVEETEEIVKAREKPEEAKKVEEKPEPSAKTTKTEAVPSSKPAAVSPTKSAGISSVNSEREARLGIKSCIQFYFEQETDGQKKRKIAEQAFVYGLSRVYRWGRINLPAAKDNITQIEGPNPIKQNAIQKLAADGELDKLIPEIELSFLNNDTFIYWMDAQRFAVQALEKKGGKLIQPAREIKTHLAWLLNRLPGLSKLVFADKKTAFADSETCKWLKDEVLSLFGGGKTQEKIIPPITTEDYAPINKIYEAACDELPEKFEVNAKAMQDAIIVETRLKGKFLRLLNLANYCYLAKRHSIARVLFRQLAEKIDTYNIIEWEQALCVAVWQTTFLNNLKLLAEKMTKQQKEDIEQQQLKILESIGKYDCVLALELIKNQPGKGE